MGHYSNPAPELTGDMPSEHIRDAPPPNQTHRAQRQLRAHDVDALVEHYRAGETIIQLAGRFGINRTTVIAHLDRRGVERRAIAKQWDHETLTSAARSYADGSSLADIAAQFGLDPSTIANRFRRAGVSIRPRRGWG
jgi:AraC-like DNA-binding protein